MLFAQWVFWGSLEIFERLEMVSQGVIAIAAWRELQGFVLLLLRETHGDGWCFRSEVLQERSFLIQNFGGGKSALRFRGPT